MKNINTLSKYCAITLLSIASIIPAIAFAADEDKNISQAEVDKKLQEAQHRLEQAAREVAELSMSKSMGSGMNPGQRFEFKLNRGALGAVIDKTDKESKGVSIISVSPGGGAETGGLRSGDVMTSINGKSLVGAEGNSKLLEELRNAKPGDKLAVGYLRDGKSAKTDVQISESANRGFAFNIGEAGQIAGAIAKSFNLRWEGAFGSAEFAPLSPKLGQYFGTDKGLLVVRAPKNPKLLLEDGDVIVDIDGRVPSNPGHASKILASYQAGEKVKINVMRMKKRQTLEVTISQEEPAIHRSSFMLSPASVGEPLPAMPSMPDIT